MSEATDAYLSNGLSLGSTAGALIWNHVLAIGYSPAYLRTNEDGMRQDWPRIPMPAERQLLDTSANLGEKITALLDSEAQVQAVTIGAIRPELKTIGNIVSTAGKAVEIPKDLEITVGWGHLGKEGIVMPGSGRTEERDYSSEEQDSIEQGAVLLGLSLEEALAQIGERTFDVFLNERVYWKNVPKNVWFYTIGGYQVIKKWLSYREQKILKRAITPDEARHVRDTIRRITAICLLQPALDRNYAAIKGNLYTWKDSHSEQS